MIDSVVDESLRKTDLFKEIAGVKRDLLTASKSFESTALNETVRLAASNRAERGLAIEQIQAALQRRLVFEAKSRDLPATVSPLSLLPLQSHRGVRVGRTRFRHLVLCCTAEKQLC